MMESICEQDFSWLINFNVRSLFKAVEVEHYLIFGGVEETTWPEPIVTLQPSAKQMGTKPSYCESTRPPFTYTDLIRRALQEKGELTVSGIYEWISEHFHFYKKYDAKWKNSLRHTLTASQKFKKVRKAPHGGGHLWVLEDSAT